MTTYTTIDPPDPTLLDIQPKFWFRDEHGKAHPVELEYLLPENSILIEETYSGKRNQNLRVESQTYMRLPYFPGDIYFNDKAVPSKRLRNKGELTYMISAEYNGASLEWLDSEKVSEYAREQSLEFRYEGVSSLVKYVAHGSIPCVTQDGRRGAGGLLLFTRIFEESLEESKMMNLENFSPEDPNNLRFMSCLSTLLTAFNIYKVKEDLERGEGELKLLYGLNAVNIHLVEVEGDGWDRRWGPF